MLATNERVTEGEPKLPRYDFSEDEQSVLVERLLAEQPPVSDGHYICYRLDTQQDEDYRSLARSVEALSFQAAFREGPEELGEMYQPYEDHSMFFLSVDRQKQKPVGALRVIANSETGLMTLNTLPEQIQPPTVTDVMKHHGITTLDNVWDVGTVGVLPEYQASGGGISVQLYRALYVSCLQNGIDHMISIIDEKPHRTMTRFLGIPFEKLAGIKKPFRYFNSESSYAVYGYVPDFYEKMSQKHSSRFSLTRRLGGAALQDKWLALGEGSRDQDINFITELPQT